jgi:hypothetical protein
MSRQTETRYFALHGSISTTFVHTPIEVKAYRRFRLRYRVPSAINTLRVIVTVMGVYYIRASIPSITLWLHTIGKIFPHMRKPVSYTST